MANEIKSRRYKWGKLYLKGDMVQAATPIYYAVDDPAMDEAPAFDSTPFQTANATHDWRRAFALVNDWLKGQN